MQSHVQTFFRRVRSSLPGDAGVGGDAAHAAGAWLGSEAQGGRRRGLEKSRKIGGKSLLIA